MAFEVAFGLTTQFALDVSSQVTISPLFNAVVEYVDAFKPTGVPLTFHTYIGVVPPFTGVAVKVIFVPAHWLPAGVATILTETTEGAVTFTLIVFDVAIPVTQVKLEVI